MIKSGVGSQVTQNDDLVLVEVSRVRRNRKTKETIWAKPLGGNLYQIKGPLHLIAGLNYDDVVKARPLHEGSIPLFLEVVTRSGHRTLHLAFARALPPLARTQILNQLTFMNIRKEMLSDLFWTLQIDPNGDYLATCEYLTSLSSQQLLIYEPEVEMDVVLQFAFGT